MEIIDEMKSEISKLEDTTVNFTIDKNPYGMYLDFPLAFDEYGRQKAETNADACISFILRAMYGDRKLLPQIQGTMLDITRFKHQLDTDYTKDLLQTRLNESIGAVMHEMAPEIELDYDPLTQHMSYNITVNGQRKARVTKAENIFDAEIEINTKKFYE